MAIGVAPIVPKSPKSYAALFPLEGLTGLGPLMGLKLLFIIIGVAPICPKS